MVLVESGNLGKEKVDALAALVTGVFEDQP